MPLPNMAVIGHINSRMNTFVEVVSTSTIEWRDKKISTIVIEKHLIAGRFGYRFIVKATTDGSYPQKDETDDLVYASIAAATAIAVHHTINLFG